MCMLHGGRYSTERRPAPGSTPRALAPRRESSHPYRLFQGALGLYLYRINEKRTRGEEGEIIKEAREEAMLDLIVEIAHRYRCRRSPFTWAHRNPKSISRAVRFFRRPAGEISTISHLPIPYRMLERHRVAILMKAW